MNRISHRSLVVVLSLSTLTAAADCGTPVEDAGPDIVGGCEVDLSFSAATAVAYEAGSTASGTLCPARDTDWFSFEVPAPGSIVRVHLWMDTALSPVEPGYSIVTGDDRPTGIAARHDDRSAGEPVDFTSAHRVDEPGTYIIKIADIEGFDDRVDVTNSYQFTLEVISDPDAFEPNESDDDASAITPGEAFTALIATDGDVDWYAVPVGADAQIIDVTATAPLDIGLNLVASLFQPDGQTLIDSRAFVGGPGAIELTAKLRSAAAGTPGTIFFLKIEEESGNASQSNTALGTYEVVINVVTNPDLQEVGGGNDVLERATLVGNGTALTAVLATLADQDLYRVDPPAGTTSANPRVLIAEIVFTGEAPDVVQPQIRIITANPERDDDELAPCSSCAGTCGPIGGGTLGCVEDYLQRVMTTRSTYTATFPLRRQRPVFVSVNDFGDNNFMETASYTINFSIVDDPDVGEIGEDYLIPNLQTATYDNDEELERQTNRSRERARNISFGFQESCEPPDIQIVDGGAVVVGVDAGVVDAGPPPMCQEVIPVPAPGPGGQLPYYVACNGQDYSTQASGRLAYEGDRDFFRFGVPESGYWAIDLSYDMSTTTPVELALFVHDGEQLIGSTLEAPQTGGECDSSTDCPPGSVCVDERCWGESDANPSFNNHAFPATNQCLFVHVNSERPVYLEVTDNGINDFDLGMQYTIDVRVRCGCPSSCDGSFQACQGAPAPAN